MNAGKIVVHHVERERGGLTRLEQRQKDLTQRIEEAMSNSPAPASTAALITTLFPNPYSLHRDIPVVLQPAEDEYIATFFDANISTSGDTQEQAFFNLKSLIVDMFACLDSEPVETLGAGPKQQIGVLRQFISKHQ